MAGRNRCTLWNFFNISDTRKVRAEKLQLGISANETVTRQALDVNVKASYIKYHGALYELQTDKRDLGSVE
jgi:hypothetical protein